MWIISKSHRDFFFDVDMKNVVKWIWDFFPYFKALETNNDAQTIGFISPKIFHFQDYAPVTQYVLKRLIVDH